MKQNGVIKLKLMGGGERGGAFLSIVANMLAVVVELKDDGARCPVTEGEHAKKFARGRATNGGSACVYTAQEYTCARNMSPK